MKSSNFLGPALALLAVVAAFATGYLLDVRLGGWVFAGCAVALAGARIWAPKPQQWGLAVRSATVDVTILLLSAAVLVFLAQTAPDLY